jgi:hypothetical protein
MRATIWIILSKVQTCFSIDIYVLYILVWMFHFEIVKILDFTTRTIKYLINIPNQRFSICYVNVKDKCFATS